MTQPFSHRSSPKVDVKRRCIPNHFFNALRQLLHIYRVKTLEFNQVYLDEEFLERVNAAFHGQSLQRLSLNIVFAENLEALSNFTFGLMVSELTVYHNYGEPITDMLSEEFVSKFGAFNPNGRCVLYVQKVDRQNQAKRVHRTESWKFQRHSLQVLGRFNNFRLHQMIVPANLLVDIISIGFDSCVKSRVFDWGFMLDSLIDNSKLEHFNGNGFTIGMIDDPHEKRFWSIKKVGSRFSCGVHVYLPMSNGSCKTDLYYYDYN